MQRISLLLCALVTIAGSTAACNRAGAQDDEGTPGGGSLARPAIGTYTCFIPTLTTTIGMEGVMSMNPDTANSSTIWHNGAVRYDMGRPILGVTLQPFGLFIELKDKTRFQSYFDNGGGRISDPPGTYAFNAAAETMELKGLPPNVAFLSWQATERTEFLFIDLVDENGNAGETLQCENWLRDEGDNTVRQAAVSAYARTKMAKSAKPAANGVLPVGEPVKPNPATQFTPVGYSPLIENEIAARTAQTGGDEAGMASLMSDASRARLETAYQHYQSSLQGYVTSWDDVAAAKAFTVVYAYLLRDNIRALTHTEWAAAYNTFASQLARDLAFQQLNDRGRQLMLEQTIIDVHDLVAATTTSERNAIANDLIGRHVEGPPEKLRITERGLEF